MKCILLEIVFSHLVLNKDTIDPSCNCKNGFLQRKRDTMQTDAAGNPCGCNFQRTTSRDTLRELPLSALKERVTALESEIKQLKTDVDHQTDKNRTALSKRKEVVANMWKDQAKIENQTEDADEQRSKKMKAQSENVKKKEKRLEELNEKLIKLRKEWGTINNDVTVELAKMATCPGCSGEKLAFVEDKEEPMDFVLKIERLELERNELQKEQMDNQSNFMAKMRQLDTEQEQVEQKADRYNSLEAKYQRQDEKRKKLIKDQIQILDPVIKDREDAVSRTETSIEKAQDHLNQLKKEISKCCKA